MGRIHDCMDAIASWYKDNGLKLNSDKCKLIVFKGMKRPNFVFKLRVDNVELEEVPVVKLLGIKIDNRLTYKEHIDALCRKISAKIGALQRISSYLSDDQNKAIANSFISSELNYCPLVWSFSNRTSLHRMQHMQDRVEVLSPGCAHVDIHRRNCETLVREVYKTKNDLNPSYMKDVFNFCEPHRYFTRNPCLLNHSRVYTTRHGLQTASYIGARLWEELPFSVRDAENLLAFTSQVKKLDSLHCRCRLCAQ